MDVGRNHSENEQGPQIGQCARLALDLEPAERAKSSNLALQTFLIQAARIVLYTAQCGPRSNVHCLQLLTCSRCRITFWRISD